MGIGFESSLVMSAIIAHIKDGNIAAVKKILRNFGIAFQIKYDLLDMKKEFELIGKDAENNKTICVAILGVADARKMMWEHYGFAMEVLQDVPCNSAFFKHLFNYNIGQDHEG